MRDERSCKDEREALFDAYNRFFTLRALYLELDDRVVALFDEAETARDAGDEDRFHYLWGQGLATLAAASAAFDLAQEAEQTMNNAWHGFLECRHENEAIDPSR